MSSGPAGRSSAYDVSTTIVVGPDGSLAAERILVRENDEQVVLVAEVALIEIAGEPAADAARAYNTPLASAGQSASMVTVLFLLPGRARRTPECA